MGVSVGIGKSKNKSSQSSQSSSTSDPWGPSIEHLRNILGGAGKFYSSGGVQQWPGSSVPGFSAPTRRAHAGFLRNAAAGSPLVDAARGATDRTIAAYAGGVPTADFYRDAMAGAVNPESPFTRFLNWEDDPDALRLQRRAEMDLEAGLARQFSAGGRAGSAAHQIDTGRAIADSRAAFNLGQRRLGMEAAAAEASFNQANANRRIAAAGGLDRAGAAQAQSLAQLGSLSRSLDDARNDVFGRLREVGADIEARRGAVLGEQRMKHYEKEMLPYEELLRYAGIVSPIAQLGGSGTARSSGSSVSRGRNIGVGIGSPGEGFNVGALLGFGEPAPSAATTRLVRGRAHTPFVDGSWAPGISNLLRPQHYPSGPAYQSPVFDWRAR